MPAALASARAAPARRRGACGLLAALLLGSLLSGCALPRRIDSEVQSFASAPVPAAGTAFDFERLPSQATAAQDTVEALAATALGKVGLVRAAAGNPASITVQASVQISPVPNPHAGHGSPFFASDRLAGRPLPSLWLNLEGPWYRHAVKLVLREREGARVAFETSARFDGPWTDSLNLLPVLFDAALQGYPNPPAGPRKVFTDLPSSPPAP